MLQTLQPRHSQNGIGNLEHDHIVSYLNHNKKLNCRPSSEKERADREKKMQRKKLKKRKKYQMVANVNGTRFEIVKSIFESFGFVLRDDEMFKTSYLIWTDSFISQERLTELQSYQRINHFMGMVEICRKDYLAKKFSKMQKLRPKDYNYYPKTWLFPQESNLLYKYIKETKNPQKKKYFILKPANGAMGMGIRLFSEDDIIKSTDHSIVQEYIDNPCLLDGYKNDFRIYVLVTSCDPLRAFIYREGLVRLSTEKYVLHPNLKSDSVFMHLTNYSVNKKNSNYTRGIDDSSGSKQSLSSLMNRFKEKFNINTDILWRKITDIIVKTLILAQPYLIHNYRMCRTGQLQTFDSVSFEILGFDILLDENLCPWLLEVNRSPSYGIDEPLDKKVKGALLIDTLRLINIKPKNKQKSMYFQKQKAHRRLTLAAFRARIDAQLDNDALRKRKEIEKRKQDLIDLLVKVQLSSSREYFENRHIGNFTRIFPPDEKAHHDHYAELLVNSFTLFNQLHNPSSSTDGAQATQQMFQSFMQNQFREEDLLEQIKECEKEENQILEKFKLPRNAELTTMIPTVDFYESSSSEDSDSSDDSGSESSSTNTNEPGTDENKSLKKGSLARLNIESRANRSSSLNSANSILRPKSAVVSSRPKAQVNKPDNPSKTTDVVKNNFLTRTKDHSNKSFKSQGKHGVDSDLNRTLQIPWNQLNEINKIYPEEDSASNWSFSSENTQGVHKDSKEASVGSSIYDELLRILLTSLTSLSIRYPNQTELETKSMLSKIYLNWDQYKKSVVTYWLVSLSSKKRDKVLQIVKTNVSSIMEENFKYATEISATKLGRLISKVYNRLLWNRGHGLIQCFSNNKSWKLILANNVDNIKPIEMEICSRIVQLCMDCVLIVYKFSQSMSEKDADNPKLFCESQSKRSNSFSVDSKDNRVILPPR